MTDVVNIPLLRKAVEWVEEQNKLEWDDPRRRWDQGVYGIQEPQKDCGSVCCVAGYIVSLEQPELWEAFIQEQSIKPSIPEAAARAMGVPIDLAWDLFNANNSAATVRALAEEFAGEKL